MTAERRPTAKGRPPVTRPASYTWRLADLVNQHGMRASVDLGPLLAQRGVVLSDAQVYRLIHYTPERLSLRTLSALCDIFGCNTEDIVEFYIEGGSALRATGTSARSSNKAESEALAELPAGFTPERATFGPTKKRQ